MFKKIAVAAFVVLAFGGALWLKDSQRQAPAPQEKQAGFQAPEAAGSPQTTQATGGASSPADERAPKAAPGSKSTGSTSPLPRLVDLGANKCIPCRKMAPILQEIAQDYAASLLVEVIDVWKNPEAGKEWGIRVIPTQIFLDASGTELFRHEGFMSKQAILDQWKELGVEVTISPPSKRS